MPLILLINFLPKSIATSSLRPLPYLAPSVYSRFAPIALYTLVPIASACSLIVLFSGLVACNTRILGKTSCITGLCIVSNASASGISCTKALV